MASRHNNSHLLQPLPEKLQCFRCPPGTYLPHTAFAKNRVSFAAGRYGRHCTKIPDDARRQLICLRCNGAPPTELQCTGRCGLVKGLDKFSRSQRTHPDTAVCLSCMYVHEHRDLPGKLHDSDDDDDDDHDDDEHGAYHLPAPKGGRDDDDHEVTGSSVSRAPASISQHSAALPIFDRSPGFANVPAGAKQLLPAPSDDDGHVKVKEWDPDEPWEM